MLKYEEILNKDYSRGRITREHAQQFEHMCRDVRLHAGLYRTPDEFDAWVEETLAMPIPGL